MNNANLVGIRAQELPCETIDPSFSSYPERIKSAGICIATSLKLSTRLFRKVSLVEARLLHLMPAIVDSIDVHDILEKSIMGEKIAHPDRFTFASIVPYQNELFSSLERAGSQVQPALPKDRNIVMTYRRGGADGSPYLDTRAGIGLVYDRAGTKPRKGLPQSRHLIAIASAGVSDKDLHIKQIQDVTGVSVEKNPRLSRQLGLHAGFSWRKALISAWEHTGRSIGASRIVIQSHTNNKWPEVRQNGHYAYDAVAEEMGYAQSGKDSSDWIKRIK